MRLARSQLAALALLAGCSVPAPAALPESLDVVRGRGYSDLGAIRLHSYRAESHGPDDPIVVVLHGGGRNADDYREAWVEPADEYGLLVLAPEFPEDEFPGSRGYNLGRMTGGLGGDRPPETWAFAFVEPLFRAAARGVGSTRDSYDLFGHSAGGQFVHRFVLYQRGASIDRAVAANSGWYTLPSEAEGFPYGLRGGPPWIPLAEAFERRLVVLLGELDDSADAGGHLRTTRAAMRQGPGRLQRGRTFAAAASEVAEERGLPLAWRAVEVPGVGHSYRDMARAAARYLYAAERR